MQLAFGLGGSLVGSMFGMPQMGFMAGSLLYTLFGSKKSKSDNRMGDLRVSSSTYGVGIPHVWGTMRVSGNLIWAPDIKERKKKKKKKFGGKGGIGGKATGEYEYFADFAYAICKGPAQEIVRIWADGDLIYDRYNKGQYYAPGTKPRPMNKEEFKKKMKRKSDPRMYPRTYLGTEDQVPDTYMATILNGGQTALWGITLPDVLLPHYSWNGALAPEYAEVNNCPAYRGVVYLAWTDMPLEDFGNRVPNISVEVTMSKDSEWEVIPMKWLPPEQRPAKGQESGGFGVYVDYLRRRLVTRNAYGASGYKKDLGFHVWDITTMEELFHKLDNDIRRTAPGVAGDVFGTYGMGPMVGMGLDGAPIVSHGITFNSAPIGLIDPETWYLKHTFGYANNGLSNTPNSVVYTSSAKAHTNTIQQADDGIGVGSGSYMLFLESIFNDIYVLNEQLEPIWGSGAKHPRGAGGMARSYDMPESGHMTMYYAGTSSLGADATISALSTPHLLSWQQNFNDDGPFIRYQNVVYTFTKSQFGDAQYLEIINMVPDMATGQLAVIIHTHSNTYDGQWLAVLKPKRLVMGDLGFDLVFLRKVNYFTNTKLEAELVAGEFAWLTGNGFFNMACVFNFHTLTYREIPAPVGKMIMPRGKQFYISAIDAILMWGEDVTPDKVNTLDGHSFNWYLVYYDKLKQTGVPLSEIVADLCELAGIPRNQIDVTDLAARTVSGYLLENPVSARSAIEELSKAYQFDGVESDNILKFKFRGKDPIVTINQDDLALVDEEKHDYYKENRTQEVELPMRLVINYNEVNKDYANNTQFWKRVEGPRPTMQSRQQEDFTIHAAMGPDEAKQTAQRILNAAWYERVGHQWKLPWNFLIYDPTDVIKFVTNDGLVFEERMLKMDIGADYSIACESISQDPAMYVSTLKGTLSDYQPPDDSLALPDPAKALVLDVPLLSDADIGGGTGSRYYLGSGAVTPFYSGANLALSTNGGADWNFIPDASVDVQTVYGAVARAVPPPPGGLFVTDLFTEIEVAVPFSYADWAPHNITDDELLEGVLNAVLIGDEIIQFRDVQVYPDKVILSHLLRGRRGTEWACHTHRPFETAVFLDDTIVRSTLPLDYIGRPLHFKAVGKGMSITTSPTTNATLHGRDLMPYAPRPFARQDKPNGDVILSWSRRTRTGGGWKDAIGTVPLNEEAELYNLYLLNAPFNPNVPFDPTNPSHYTRKFEGLITPQVTYTQAMQLTDGYDAKIGPLHAVVFQVSASVGAGFPGWGTTWRYKVA